MHQLAYISTIGLHMREQDIEDILQVSRSNNRRDGITGLLVADGVRFLQVLEGEQAQVEAAFNRISGDERHFGIFALARKEVDAREFGEWDMAYRQVTSAADEGDLIASAVRLTAELPDGEIKERPKHFLRLDRQIL